MFRTEHEQEAVDLLHKKECMGAAWAGLLADVETRQAATMSTVPTFCLRCWVKLTSPNRSSKHSLFSLCAPSPDGRDIGGMRLSSLFP